MADLKEKTNQPHSDEANNPGERLQQELYDREFKGIENNFDKTADPSKENSNIEKLRQSEKEGGKDDRVAVGDTAAGKAAASAASTVGTPIMGAAAKLLSKVKTKRGGAVTGVAGVIIVILMAIAALSPSALLLSIKDTGLKWSTHFSNISMSKRMGDVMEKRYFTDPSTCKGAKIVCRFTPGMTDEELNDLKRNNLITDDDIAESNGKKYLKRMTFVSGGKTTIVTKSNFKTRFTSFLPFRSKLTNVIDSRALITRSPAALKKFSLFGVERRAPLGETGDEKARLKIFRQVMYGKKNAVNLSPDTSNTGEVDPDTQTKLDGLEGMDELTAQAEYVSKDAVTNGPIPLVPDTNALAATNPGDIVLDGAKGTLKTSLMGFFAAADSACSIYNTIRILNFAAKAYAAAALIKYAGLFMTIADKQKSSEVSAAEVALLAGVLVTPSFAPGSKGKDFSQSQGFNLINYGRITRPEDLARFSIGTTGMNALNKVYEVFNFGGLSSDVCRAVKSWWGQLSLIGMGILTGVFSLGAGFVAGAAVSFATALALSYIVQVMTMKLVPIIAGTVVPDPETDPEGGYGAGNAIAAGLGAFSGELGKAAGLRPLFDSQANALAMSDEAKMIAKVDEAKQRSGNPFDLNSSTSIPNQIAIAMTPLTTQKQSLGAYVSALSSIFGTALSRPLNPTVGAESYTLDSYGGKYCAEKYDSYIVENEDIQNLARDANCNMIYGANPATLDTTKFGIDATMAYMINGDWVDPDTGEPTSTDAGTYGKWVESCVEGTDPIVDAYSADLEGSEDPSMCYEKGEKLDYFRTYRQYMVSNEGIQKAAEDKLGTADASTAATAPAETPTTSTGSMIWPIDKEDWPSSRNNPILSCKLLYDASSGMSGVHTGIDIMAMWGTPIRAAAAGKVTMKSTSYGAINIQTGLKSGGKTVYINYQHMVSISVGVGDMVKQGQIVGRVGVTGTWTGFPPLSNAHLHFGTWTTNTFLSGHDSPSSSAGRATLSQMLHPMTFMPEDGRKVSNCVKPYVVP